MNPTGFDESLFRGIPPNRDRGPGSYFTSLLIHAAAVAFLLLAAPKLILNNQAGIRFNTTLVAPAEPPAVPKRVPPPALAIQAAAPTPRELRPLPRPAEPRVSLPKLDPAPVLPNVTQPKPLLPVQNPVIQPPVQTGVFAANLAPKAEPKLPVAPAREAGFNTIADASLAVPKPASAAPVGFDVRSAATRPVAQTAVIQTGGFSETSAAATRNVAGKVSRTGFDAGAENAEPAALNATIRKTGFDEPQAVNTPVKQATPAVAAVRPIEILDKPKPAYTAEARAQKIEGTVLLDVIFSATGEVRVLGVVRGLGHGLDENAADAARRIHFTPAKQGGVAVDQRVLLHVVFQITG